MIGAGWRLWGQGYLVDLLQGCPGLPIVPGGFTGQDDLLAPQGRNQRTPRRAVEPLNVRETRRFQIGAHQDRTAGHDRPALLIDLFEERLTLVRLAHIQQDQLPAGLQHAPHLL